VADPDGSNLTNVTNFPGSDAHPAWSADGLKIAYSSAGYFGATSDIWYVGPDGSGKTRVTAKPSNEGAADATWSPDGAKVAYTNIHGSPAFNWLTLNVTNADGTNDQELCCGLESATEPTWSPDGTKIAFTHSARAFQGPRSLWTMNADGTGAARICCEGLEVTFPDWSPDGRTIMFQSAPSYYGVNPDGTGLRTLYTRPAGAGLGQGAWSPDGQRIVFAQSDNPRSAGPAIFTMRADGSDRVQVSPTTAAQNQGFNYPSWQPIPGPKRTDYRNAAQFCKAERAFLGERQFRQKYGTGPKTGANAHGNCVRRNR
jgi:Tol biopolymer transport system component